MTKHHNHSDICEIEQKYGFSHNENPDFNYTYKLIKLDNYDKKDETHRKMAWYSLFGMLIYPFLVVITELLNIPNASSLIADMSGVYFASVSVIVMVYFGANAYVKRNDNEKDNN